MIKKLCILEIDGGAEVVESASFAKVSDDLDADSSGDRSVGVPSCDDMLLNTEMRQFT